MRKLVEVLAVVLVFSFLGIALFWFVNGSKPKVTALAQAEEVTLSSDGLWNLIQNWRKDNGLAQYVRSDKLCEIANIRVSEVRRSFNHDLFNADRFGFVGTLSENIANSYNNKEALTGWLNSPAHRKALEHNYRKSCIAVSGVYAVQIFSY